MVFKKSKIARSKMNEIEQSTESQGCFPDDLFIMILLCLPADILYNVMRYVCRHWYKIIQSPDFISTHLEKSKPGLVITQTWPGKRWYVTRQTSHHGYGVEVKEFKSSKCSDNIQASCDGLVFVIGPEIELRFPSYPCYVANLATKQYLPLPILPITLEKWRFYLSYASASRLYKVLCHTEWRSYILTVGVDLEWRQVDMSRLTLSANEINWYPIPDYSLSVSVNGFVYWVQRRNQVPFIFCFDIETETFRPEILLPPQFHNKDEPVYHPFPPQFYSNGLLAMERSLCVYRHVNSYSFEFWSLNYQQNGDGEWKKLPDINLTESELLRSPEAAWITPYAWLNREQLVLKAPNRVLVYNLSTGELHQIEELNKEPDTLFAHLNSLVNLSMVMKNGRLCKSIRAREKVYSEKNMMAEFEEILGQLI